MTTDEPSFDPAKADRMEGIHQLLANRFGLHRGYVIDALPVPNVTWEAEDGPTLYLQLDLAKAEELVYALGMRVPGDVVSDETRYGTKGTYLRTDGGIEKRIVFCGQAAKIACDAKCEKAWGINTRPKVFVSRDENDYYYQPDGALETAPENPGTTEGPDGKPRTIGERLNRWCARECERCTMSKPGEIEQPLVLKDFSIRRYNFYAKQDAYEAALARGETPA